MSVYKCMGIYDLFLCVEMGDYSLFLTCSFFVFGLLLFVRKKEQAVCEYIKYV